MADKDLPPRDPHTGKFESPTPPTINDPKPPAAPDPKPPSAPDPKAKAEPKVGPSLNKLAASFLGLDEKKSKANPESDPDPKAKPPKDTPPAAPDPAPPAATPPATPKAPAKPKAAKTAVKPASGPAPAPIDPEQIAAKVAEGVARAMQKPGAAPAAPPAAPTLTESDNRRLQVYERLEKLFPDRYKDLASKQREFLKRAAEYADRWEKEHPGETFDPDDDEHNDLYSEEPSVDQDDYIEGLSDIRAEVAASRDPVRKKFEEKIDELEREKAIVRATPQINKQSISAARTLWAGLGEEFADVVAEDGTVNAQKLAEMQANDPVATGLRINAANMMRFEAPEIYKLMNGLVKNAAENPPDNPDEQQKQLIQIHRNVNAFGYELEQWLLSRPEAERVDEHGRMFMDMPSYYCLKADQREKYWTLTPEVVIIARAQDLARQTREFIEKEEEKFKQWATARGLQLPNSPATQSPPPVQRPTPPPDERELKPKSPPAVAPSKLAAAKTQNGGESASGRLAFVLRGFGSR